jgi:hypothetical protein
LTAVHTRILSRDAPEKQGYQVFKIAMVVLLASLGFAQAQQILVCDMDSELGRSAISNQFVFRIDPAAGTAIVNDMLITGTTGGPITAEIANETASRYTIKWRIDSSNNTQYRSVPTLLFRATINKADNRITIGAQPPAFDNRFFSAGTCAPQ